MSNPGEIVRNISDELDKYLHPLTGGNDGAGWPFAGTLFYAELLQRLLTNVDDVRAIPRLRLIVDGVPQGPCKDVPLRQTELFRPLDHQVIPMESEENRLAVPIYQFDSACWTVTSAGTPTKKERRTYWGQMTHTDCGSKNAKNRG